MLTISDRAVTKAELNEIYADITKVKAEHNIPQTEKNRYEIIAEDGGAVVGFAAGQTEHRWFYLSDLWVREDYRRQGLGARVLGMLEDKVRSVGIDYIWTWTTGLVNPKFYESQGYAKFTVSEDFCQVKGYHRTGYRKGLNI
jgi:N-acetylglutamate synthase-like GNAT family acetyltransferase